jgi:hypothetical protein
MSNYWIGILLGMGLLVAAIPYVMRIRHPQQKPLAAYLIFMSVFIAVAAVLFKLLVWLAGKLGLGDALGDPGPALLFIALVFLPAVALAAWQARKPPWRQGPPD